ncbi:MAG: hypothetical protein JNM78_06160 [Cyclobacteriaceae bacterium]|nr:hypothetical protein [Cyclobacteriaceae bacterium]
MPELHPFISGKWQANIQPPAPGPEWFTRKLSFGYLPNKQPKSIFLGTFPTYEVVNLVRQSGNNEFFYGSRENRFWQLLEFITSMPIGTEHQMFQILHSANFGVTDILKEIDRNGHSSADNDLTPRVFNNVIDLKNNFSSLTNIYTTSGGKGSITNGTPVSAAKWLLDSLLATGHTVTGFNVIGYQKQISVSQNGNLIWKFNLINLWSPSDSGNTPIQGFINRNLAFSILLASLQVPFNNLSLTMKARLVQWGFLLRLNGFPVTPQLNSVLTANNALLTGLFV